MTLAIQQPHLLSLAAGFTDNATLPLEEISKIAVELGEQGDRSVLQYGANQGSLELREILTRRLSDQDRFETPLDVSSSLITNGSQQALYLAVQALCDEGDIVLVEQPTYFVFLEMLRGLGVEAVSMPMSSNGDVDVDGLKAQLSNFEKAGKINRVKAVYLVSYYANPSGHSVSRSCKSGVLKALEAYGGQIALFEDAAYRELYYETPFESESCLALSEGAESVPVFYSTTLTKPFATGLKVGFSYCTHAEWLARMLAIKGQQDFGTANYNQALLARAFKKGVFDSHLSMLRKSYHEKMVVLDSVLSGPLSEVGWTWERPSGGLYLWLTAPEGTETGFDSDFHKAAIEAGVLYVPGELCHAQVEPRNKVRLSFGVLSGEELVQAAERFLAAVKRFSLAEIS
ncbi:PLP-dependent aminotransferase family protein [Pelagicoccus mobilis]|uniref:PLP-dependent aminotransferase family protein n=1 Tax=Pelagicoccus mobilis TaxID=415221 RepID=A0A934VPD1_9BACT|nr:PLP-dependent aminotransferase family protein [Pelagicoccus mobilis]MBK1877162.1 PLP-dependent aminotransferase family protein [Pelagicoccus mobilis]